jgi:DNA-binding ferritin-like protein (Dps family)|tara:strand:- start:1764 stop:1961 length:198 start_codon:yes stop_codon:yes gene_type:complete
MKKQPNYAEMRYMLSYRETEDLNYKDIQEILLFGTIGYNDLPDEEIMKLFLEMFEESEIPKKEVK